MKVMRLLFLISLLAAGLAHAQSGPTLTDQARFLAGMPVRDSALDRFAHEQTWVEHATAMDSAFNKQETRQLGKVRAWASGHVPEANSGGTMYYMFSGPDFLYANTFFPNASTYIFCGTEPVGAVPDITHIAPDQLNYALAGLRDSMKTMLSFHYFITKEMRADLNHTNLGGTLPILYVFLARTGHPIQSVTYVNSPAQGVKIVFGGGRPQTLYYFKVDLSNGGGSAKFLNWCAQQGPGVSLVKAASYLMHSDGFSGVRNFLLNNSKVLVQDDSGIPLHNFDKRWTLRFYGKYTEPIELFAKNYQPDLAQAYATNGAQPIDFAFGYHWQLDQGVLMVGERK